MPGHVLISSMKDEGPFIVEFVAHHLELGFDHIVIASNDCRDGSDALLDVLAERGHIGHVRNRLEPGDIPQHAGYVAIRHRHPIDAADWLMMLDADEFLCVSVGDGTVQALTVTAAPDIDVIALNAVTFGSRPHTGWQPGRVCGQFQYRLPLGDRANIAVKSLTRGPSRFAGIHNHHMVGFRGAQPVRVMRADRSVFEVPRGVPLWQRLRNFPPKEVAHDIAHYNHYAVKTEDSFMVRRDRGRGAVAVILPGAAAQEAAAAAPEGMPQKVTPISTPGASAVTQPNTRHDAGYFAARAGGAIFDDRIDAYASRVRARIAAMLSDPGIAEAQAATEAGYRALLAPYR